MIGPAMTFDPSSGYHPTTLQAWRNQLETATRQVFGNDVDLHPETLLGQLISIFSEFAVNIDERLLAVANGTSFQRAIGTQLDDINTIHNIRRVQARRSEVDAVMTGVPGTTIPAGLRASTTVGADFRLKKAATIGASQTGTGTVTARFEAIQEGEVIARTGTLTRLIDVVTGLRSITNPAPAVVGSAVESDATFRVRSAALREANAISSVEAIRAAVLAAGSESCSVFENVTGNPILAANNKGSPIDAHSVLCIVAGGTDTQVANAIRSKLPAGTRTSGTVPVTLPGGIINFSRTQEVPIDISIAISRGDSFPSNGFVLIRDLISDYVNALPTGRHIDLYEIAAEAYAAVPPPAMRLTASPTATRRDGVNRLVTTDATVNLVEKLTVADEEQHITITTS